MYLFTFYDNINSLKISFCHNETKQTKTLEDANYSIIWIWLNEESYCWVETLNLLVLDFYRAYKSDYVSDKFRILWVYFLIQQFRNHLKTRTSC